MPAHPIPRGGWLRPLMLAVSRASGMVNVMTPSEKQVWDSVRARGHARFVLRSLVRWGVPFGVVVTFGPLLYDAAMHTSYTPRVFPWPALDIVFGFVFCSALFGYLTGEGAWRKHERDYGQSSG